MGVDRHRTTVHLWVQKADLQPTDGSNPNHAVVDETVIQLNSERYWLYGAVDPDTNRLLHVRLYPTRTKAISSMFLSELREKHQVDDAVFVVDGAPWLQAACHRHGPRFQHVTHGNRNAIECADDTTNVNTGESHASLARRWLSPHRGISKDCLIQSLRAFQLRRGLLPKTRSKSAQTRRQSHHIKSTTCYIRAPCYCWRCSDKD